MLKIFISTHGHFASGIKNSVDILFGNTDNITAFDAYIDERSIKDQLEAFYNTVTEDDQVFLLSDLSNGSVNQTMYLYKDKRNTTVITGINLSLVLELVSRDEVLPGEVDEIIASSREMLHVVKEEEDSNDNADFF